MLDRGRSRDSTGLSVDIGFFRDGLRSDFTKAKALVSIKKGVERSAHLTTLTVELCELVQEAKLEVSIVVLAVVRRVVVLVA
jgi:hypothetical protein